MDSSNTTRRVVVNDDAWLIHQALPPLTVDDLRRRIIDTYAGAPIQAFSWSIGGHEVFDYETVVGEQYGCGYANLSPADRKHADNIQSLIKECGGPLTALIDLCHEAGFDFWSSVRMNEHYDIDTALPNYGRFRRENPELLIGRVDEKFVDGSLDWGLRTGLDYSFAAVRNYMADQICESFERFGADGVDLDFGRHPAYFRPREAYANRGLMTDLVRTIRKRMTDVTDRSGRNLTLAVRVSPTVRDSERVGLDVLQWISEDLVDLVIVGFGFVPFSSTIKEFVAAADGTDCRIYGSLEHLGLAMDDDKIRAIAAWAWESGADGIYLFNYFGKATEWKSRILTQVSDRLQLQRLDKRYHLDHTDRLATRDLHDYPFRYAISAVQLPVSLPPTLTGRGPIIELPVADDVDAARREGALNSCGLRLSFDHFMAEDEIEVWLNNEVLSSDLATKSYRGWWRMEWTQYGERVSDVKHPGGIVEYDLRTISLRRGVNELEIRVVNRTVQQPNPLILRDVELSIRYERV
jgi:hypothetical protein